MVNKKSDPRRRGMLKTLMKSVCDHNKIEITDVLKYKSSHQGYLILFDDFNYMGDHLSFGGKELWKVLNMHVDHRYPDLTVIWPSQPRIAILMGLKTTRQVRHYLDELRSTKPPLLISRRRQDKTTLHVLLDPPKEWAQSTKKKLKKEKESKPQQTG